MAPFPRPATQSTGVAGRQVQSKILSRFAQTSDVNIEEQRRQFREARQARELERLVKLRDCRLKNSSAAASNVSATVSITSSSSSLSRVVPPKLGVAAKQGLSLAKAAREPCFSRSQAPARTTSYGNSSTSSRKPRRSQGGRKSILKLKVDSKVAAKAQKLVRKFPKAEVKLTKTTQLRMLKSDPLLELSQFSKSLSNHIVMPLPTYIPKYHNDKKSSFNSKQDVDRNVNPQSSKSDQETQSKVTKKISFVSPPGKVPSSSALDQQSPSRIPVSTFGNSFKKPSTTPKPSPLRKRLSEWLEKRNHSLDNFKHLKCFGILGPVVKRPQTPFRKNLLSTSTLRAIPERKESSPLKVQDSGDDTDDNGQMNTTFTLEEEDKENICHGGNEQVEIPQQPQAEHAEGLKDFDQAHGVLSELHKLIQMGYPVDQCQLWLRAIRRRFPQCGDEASYWECLASLEESRGDLQTAVSCYERALIQGAQDSVQNSLDELLKKMSALNIVPIVNTTLQQKNSKSHKNVMLESSNIIKVSAIQFAVQEKCSSSKKNELLNDSSDLVFTATPVRRSVRLAATPKKGTPGVTCVRSLEFLEPEVRNALVFHNNSALEPKD